MNDLLRPSLYGAYHEIVPVSRSRAKRRLPTWSVLSAETGDFFALDRELPLVSEEICWPFWTWRVWFSAGIETTTRAAGRRKCLVMARGRE